MIDYFKKIEGDSLNPSSISSNTNNVENSLKRPLEIMAMSASTTTDCLQKLAQIQAQSNNKSLKSFSKLAPTYQQMLLIASSKGEAVPSKLGDEALSFFSQSSTLNAQIFINSYLENLKIEVSVSAAVTTSLQHGSFVWYNSLTPSGFASSVLTSMEIMRPDLLHEGIVLDYSTKHEMSA